MGRPPRYFGIVGALVASLRCGPAAYADTPPERAVVLLRVAPEATEIDPSALEVDLAAELGADVVRERDARAAGASGELDVSVDRPGQELVVTYRARGAPITRRVAMPPDAATVERDAVVLAGNLARDEAKDLVEQLHASHAEAATAAEFAGPRGSPAIQFPADDDAERRELLDLAITLEEHSSDARRRKVVWSTFLAAGLATDAAASVAFVAEPHSDAGFWLFEAGMALQSATLLVAPGHFDGIERTYQSERAAGAPADIVLDDTMEEWRRVGRIERHNRTVVGCFLVVPGALATGLAALAFVGYATHPSAPWVDPASLALFAVPGVVSLTGGVYEIATPGPVQSALREYEARRAPAAAAGHLEVRPTAGVLPGGGFLALGGRF